MKINKNRILNRKTIILAVVILLSIFTYGVAALNNNLYPFSKDEVENAYQEKSSDGIDYNKPTDDQIKAGEDQKKSTATPNKDEVTDNNPDETTTNSLGVTVTTNQNNPYVQVRALIDKISDSGSCDLTMSKGDVKVVKTSAVQSLPSGSTCRGFDVLVSELSGGKWDVSVVVNIGQYSGSVSSVFEVM